MILHVDSEDKINIRLDSFIKSYSDLSRTYIASLIDEGYVMVNDNVVEKVFVQNKLNDIINVTKKKLKF